VSVPFPSASFWIRFRRCLLSGYYSSADWNTLSYEERDKICKERDKKGEQGGTKRTIGNISVEPVTAIIGAMQQAPSVTSTNESATTHETTLSNQAGNAFVGKASSKKMLPSE
jgi:hypothetical protein